MKVLKEEAAVYSLWSGVPCRCYRWYTDEAVCEDTSPQERLQAREKNNHILDLI